MTELKEVLEERNKSHGDFREQFVCAQEIKSTFKNWKGYKLLNGVQREVLDQIAHKISRVLTGDPDFADHWVDIAGYATCAAQQNTRDDVA